MLNVIHVRPSTGKNKHDQIPNLEQYYMSLFFPKEHALDPFPKESEKYLALNIYALLPSYIMMKDIWEPRENHYSIPWRAVQQTNGLVDGYDGLLSSCLHRAGKIHSSACRD